MADQERHMYVVDTKLHERLKNAAEDVNMSIHHVVSGLFERFVKENSERNQFIRDHNWPKMEGCQNIKCSMMNGDSSCDVEQSEMSCVSYTRKGEIRKCFTDFSKA